MTALPNRRPRTRTTSPRLRGEVDRRSRSGEADSPHPRSSMQPLTPTLSPLAGRASAAPVLQQINTNSSCLGSLLLLIPGELRVVPQHHPVDIGGQILELRGALAQLRVEEGSQNACERAEGRGIGPARLLAHQIGLVPELDRQRKQRADREIDVLVRGVTAKPAQEIVLRNTELRVLAQPFAHVLRRPVEEMRR